MGISNSISVGVSVNVGSDSLLLFDVAFCRYLLQEQYNYSPYLLLLWAPRVFLCCRSWKPCAPTAPDADGITENKMSNQLSSAHGALKSACSEIRTVQ